MAAYDKDLEPPPSTVPGWGRIWIKWLWEFYRWVRLNMGRDWYIDVSAGRVTGYSTVTKFGRATSITNGSDVDIAPFTPTYLTTASTIRIKAGGNAADTAAGTGAQAVVVVGLDANYNEITDTLVTAGASASSATTNTYLRVTRAYVTTVGSGETNAAAITIEAVTGGSTQAIIPASGGQTQQIMYTVPAGKRAYVKGIRLSLIDSPGAGTTQHLGHFKGKIRLYDTGSNNNYQSWRTVFDYGLDTDGSNDLVINSDIPVVLPAKTDVTVTVYTHSAGGEADCRLIIVLEDI